MNDYEKLGYLNSDFKIFYLSDTLTEDFGYHYHDFYKILIFLDGNVTYFVEGRTYKLYPFDIILVSPGEIHGPIIQNDSKYERIIIYISNDFFSEYINNDYNLSECFLRASKESSNLIRAGLDIENRIIENINDLRYSFCNSEYANELYKKIKFMEFIINLNRSILKNDMHFLIPITSNKKVIEIMEYINNNLSCDINIDIISENFYLNRSYLMHLFKNETGCTIGNYITEKRLFTSKKMISEGAALTDACYKCGFKNYVSFYRAFKSKYKVSPKEIKKQF